MRFWVGCVVLPSHRSAQREDLSGMKRFIGIVLAGLLFMGLAACQTPETEFITGSADGATSAGGPDIPASEVRFALEPFTGAPGNTADEISRRISQAAEKDGLSLTRRNAPDVTHRVSGYLAVTGDDSRGVLVYVFDVFDRTGRRVFRFTGQEAVGPSGGDPWQGVDADSINNVAERTVQSLEAWLNRVPAS